MALVVSGTVAALGRRAEDKVAPGKVWIGDDGFVAAVTAPGGKAPRGFETAAVVDVGDALILPGFLDLHSHLAYNMLPLWTERTQTEPWAHRNDWPDAESYKPDVAWPAGTLLLKAPECVYAYAQVRALAGGTTAIQGWPPASRSPSNRLVRSVDDDSVVPPGTVGVPKEPVLVSVRPFDPAGLRKKLARRDPAAVFVYHCAEGRPGSAILDEFEDAATADCLQPWMIAIHGTALERSHFERWAAASEAARGQASGTVVWSPLSNLWLYGTTTNVPVARRAKLRVCLGTDWGPSGTKNLLGELKVARLWADKAGWTLTDHDLVRMVTAWPGDALAGAWGKQSGRLVPGGLGDLVVLSRRSDEPWTDVVTARERDVQLVVVGGRARLGTAELMAAAGVRASTSVPVDGVTRRVTLVRPDDPSKTWTWKDVVGRLDAVRADAARRPPVGPAGESGSAERSGAGDGRGSGDPDGTPPLVARPDMPGPGGVDSAGPPPPGRLVTIPPIEALHHDKRWHASVRGRGFHDGLLDGLAKFWR